METCNLKKKKKGIRCSDDWKRCSESWSGSIRSLGSVLGSRFYEEHQQPGGHPKFGEESSGEQDGKMALFPFRCAFLTSPYLNKEWA